ncbi:MAG: winged helix-turn-helix transcriptional regulator [Alphaproteobacteria bacterium]
MISNKKILDCPVATTINLIGNKWKLLIIRDLLASTRRFGELRKNLERISQRVLTQNLRELENDGLIKRKVYAEVPPRVEYSLNELGRSLLPIISTMANWGNNYKKTISNK